MMIKLEIIKSNSVAATTRSSHASGNGQTSTRITRQSIICFQGNINEGQKPNIFTDGCWFYFKPKMKRSFRHSLVWSFNIHHHCSCSCFLKTVKWQFSTLLRPISKQLKQNISVAKTRIFLFT